MEVHSAMRRRALEAPAITGYTSERVWRGDLEEGLERTGKAALVFNRKPGWATPDTVQTIEYPTVWADCYADPTRDEFGDVALDDGEDKAYALARAVERTFHARRGEWWGAVGSNPGLMVVTCVRGQEPYLPGETRSGQRRMFPDLGDTVLVRTVWHLQVANGPRG